jgi:hypothetical protein
LRLHFQTVRKLVAAGEIPVKRFGHCARVPWAWLREQTGEPEKKTA